jgi:predicted metal-dependent phosphoesterase TrpH
MPEKYIDLHIHTNASDGTSLPDEVYHRALKFGLAAFAITDHDTLDGYYHIRHIVDQDKVELIPAVELSGWLNGEDVHILGYLIDPDRAVLVEKLKVLKQARSNRAALMVEKLNKLGINLSLARVQQLAGHSTIGRPHIADALLKNGLTSTYDEAFHKYIGTDGPAYEPKKYMSAQEAIDLIQASGGVAVLAHPGILGRDDLIIDLLEMRLDGIEAFHCQHDPYLTNHYMQMAKKYGLVFSGGSDCHGMRKGRFLMGTVKVPYRCLTMLRQAQEARL